MQDIIVIGCGAAGMTAGIYASRAGADVLILEGNSVGGQIASSPKIENFPAFESGSGLEFSEKLYSQAESFGVKFEFDKATSIEKTENGFNVKCEFGSYEAKSVIIATGMSHRKLGIEREEELVGNGVSYCAVCDGAFYEGMEVAVNGGGNSALQEALYLANICKKVYLIHRRNEFRADEILVKQVKSCQNIEIVTPCTIKSLCGEESLTSIIVKSEEKEKEIDVRCLFVAIGSNPDTEFIKDFIKLDENSFVDSDESCRTNIEGIFVCGDCRKKKLRQLTTAVADGAVAAVNAVDFCRR